MKAPLAGRPGGTREAPRPAPVLEISCFTDPLCCWSWGFEPQLRRLRHGFAGRMAWSVRMGVMIADWQSFNDPVNDIHRPVQMGPLWLEAAEKTGMPIDPAIWVEDPPASSWPASIAVRAAGLQSALAADLLLRRIRKAVMTDRVNVAREDALFMLADELARDCPGLFDAARFREDFHGAAAKSALRDDVRETRFLGIGRFPTLRLHAKGRDPEYLVGWRDWDALVSAVTAYCPTLGPERIPAGSQPYSRYWGDATAREIEVATAES